MKLKFNLKHVLFFLVLSSIAINCFGKNLTAQEEKIYHEFIRRIYALNIATSSIEDENRVYEEVANKYGISTKQFDAILNKVYSQYLTKQEEQILNKLAELTRSLPKGSDYSPIYKEVADKFGMTVFEVQEIEFRGTGWFNFFF